MTLCVALCLTLLFALLVLLLALLSLLLLALLLGACGLVDCRKVNLSYNIEFRCLNLINLGQLCLWLCLCRLCLCRFTLYWFVNRNGNRCNRLRFFCNGRLYNRLGICFGSLILFLVEGIEVDAARNLNLGLLFLWLLLLWFLCDRFRCLHNLWRCNLLHLFLELFYSNNGSLGLLLVLTLLGELVGLHADFLVGAELLDEHVVTLLGYNCIRILLDFKALLL